MRHLLTSILAFHWAAVFGLLAAAAVLEGDGGMASVLSLMGTGHDGAVASAPWLSMLLSFGCTMVTILFLWAFITAAFAGPRENGDLMGVLRLAFAGAALLMTFVVIAGAAQGINGLAVIAAAYLAAILASYLAIFAERWSIALSSAPGQEDVRAAARVMALGAAHSTMLARLSGRTGPGHGGSR